MKKEVKEAGELVLSLFFVSDDVLWRFAEAVKAMGAEIGITNFKVIKKQILDESFIFVDQQNKGRVIFDKDIVIEKMEKIMKTRGEIIISAKKEVKAPDDSGYINQI